MVFEIKLNHGHTISISKDPHTQTKIMMQIINQNLNNLPVGIQINIYEYARPTKLDSSLKREVELYGTLETFQQTHKKCDKKWEAYYKYWNLRGTPGFVYNIEDEPKPSCMWTYIEKYLVKYDKNIAQHYLNNLKAILEDENMMNKVSNYDRIEWTYFGGTTQKYEKVKKMYTAHRLKKDLTSYIECLKGVIKKAEIEELRQARIAEFNSYEDYLDAMDAGYLDYENEYYDHYVSVLSY